MRVESEVGNDGTRTEAFLELCKGVGRARECRQGSGAGEKAEERQVVLVISHCCINTRHKQPRGMEFLQAYPPDGKGTVAEV